MLLIQQLLFKYMKWYIWNLSQNNLRVCGQKPIASPRSSCSRMMNTQGFVSSCERNLLLSQHYAGHFVWLQQCSSNLQDFQNTSCRVGIMVMNFCFCLSENILIFPIKNNFIILSWYTGTHHGILVEVRTTLWWHFSHRQMHSRIMQRAPFLAGLYHCPFPHSCWV